MLRIRIRIQIRIQRIHVFLGLLDPDPEPLVSSMDPDPDPDPSIFKISTVLWLLFDFLPFKNDVKVSSKSNMNKNFFKVSI